MRKQMRMQTLKHRPSPNNELAVILLTGTVLTSVYRSNFEGQKTKFHAIFFKSGTKNLQNSVEFNLTRNGIKNFLNDKFDDCRFIDRYVVCRFIK